MRPILSPKTIPKDAGDVHAQSVLCARLSRVLHYALLGLDWSQVRYSDRTRLERSLTLLAGDIPLVWLIAGQPLEDTSVQRKPKRDASPQDEQPSTGSLEK